MLHKLLWLDWRKVFYLCCFVANKMRVVFLIFSHININCIPSSFKLSIWSNIFSKIHGKAIPNNLLFMALPRCNTYTHNTDAKISPEGKSVVFCFGKASKSLEKTPSSSRGKDMPCINTMEWVLHLISAPILLDLSCSSGVLNRHE